jgi:hypothetical protein
VLVKYLIFGYNISLLTSSGFVWEKTFVIYGKSGLINNKYVKYRTLACIARKDKKLN